MVEENIVLFSYTDIGLLIKNFIVQKIHPDYKMKTMKMDVFLLENTCMYFPMKSEKQERVVVKNLNNKSK